MGTPLHNTTDITSYPIRHIFDDGPLFSACNFCQIGLSYIGIHTTSCTSCRYPVLPLNAYRHGATPDCNFERRAHPSPSTFLSNALRSKKEEEPILRSDRKARRT